MASAWNINLLPQLTYSRASFEMGRSGIICLSIINPPVLLVFSTLRVIDVLNCWCHLMQIRCRLLQDRPCLSPCSIDHCQFLHILHVCAFATLSLQDFNSARDRVTLSHLILFLFFDIMSWLILWFQETWFSLTSGLNKSNSVKRSELLSASLLLICAFGFAFSVAFWSWFAVPFARFFFFLFDLEDDSAEGKKM